MIELGLPFEPFQFDKATQGGEEVGGLGGDSLCGRLDQRDILLERFVITLHFPPFVVGRSEGGKRQGGLTGDQITHAGAAVCVCEDLFAEEEREIDSFELDFPRGLRFQFERSHSDIAALGFVRRTQGHFAIGLEGTDKIAFLLLFNESQGVRRSEPDSEEHEAKGKTVGHRLLDEVLTDGIFGHRTASVLFLRLGVRILLGLGH